MEKKKAYLILENGRIFEGYRFGAEKETAGELVFTTGMCGYIETLTDPSYFGQIVMQTYPLIGNYGIIGEDFEGSCSVRGYVVREWCSGPSNFRMQGDLDSYLKEQDIPGIYGVDTREITRIIRETGVMNAVIENHPLDDAGRLKTFRIENAVSSVTRGSVGIFPASDQREKYRVALLDYGVKQNIIRSLTQRGCLVTVYPASASAEEILSGNPSGVMLSNGPGDPADAVFEIAQIRKLLGKIPLFGICLGHQLTALAAGAKTYKLKYGHRGVNQPVKDLETGHTCITTQNHGYAVDAASIPYGRLRYVNANDNTCEGIDYPEWNAFTVQFHPEACAGPKDTGFLFDRFLSMMKEVPDNAS